MSHDDYYDDDYEDLLTPTRPVTGFGSPHPLATPALARPFLDQDESWCAAGIRYLAIAAMTPSHALAAANYILARATSVALVLLASGDRAVDLTYVSDEQRARTLLLETPLVDALIRRGRDSREAVLPWVAASRAASAR